MPRKRAPKSAALTVATLAEVASLFGVSPTALADRWRTRGAPLEGPPYDLAALIRWREEDFARQLRTRQQLDAPQPEAATDTALETEITLAEAKANPAWADKVEAWRAKQLKNAVAVGQLIHWDTMLRALGIVVVKTRTRLEQIAYDFAQELPADSRDDLTRRLVELIRAALYELSTFNPLAYLVSSARELLAPTGGQDSGGPDGPVSADPEPVLPQRQRRNRRVGAGTRRHVRRKKMG